MIQQGKTLNSIYLHKVELADDGLMRLVLTARKLSDGDTVVGPGRLLGNGSGACLGAEGSAVDS